MNENSVSENTISIHPLMAQRRSAVAFSSQPIEREKLLSVLEAARWAPSSRNDQPWRFIVASQEQPESFAQFLACLSEPNQTWAQNAYALICAVAKTGSFLSGDQTKHAWLDTGLAISQLVLQATSLGLNTHIIGGFSRSDAREVMQIPEGFEPVTLIALGYPGKIDHLSPALQVKENRERKRTPLSAIAFAGTWDSIMQ